MGFKVALRGGKAGGRPLRGGGGPRQSLLGGKKQAGTLPDAISGLTFWFRSDLGTFQDTGFTTVAVADGDVVGGWRDQSGGVRDLTQATEANKPLLKTSRLNGKPSLLLDGTNDTMTNSAVLTLKPASVFVVGRVPNVTGVKVMFGGSANDTLSLSVVGQQIKLTRVNLSVIAATGDIISANTWFFAEATYASNGDYEILLNGTSQTTGTNNVTIGSGSMAFGFNQPANAEFYNGDITELIIYDNVISSANRTGLETYVNDRYAIW